MKDLSIAAILFVFFCLLQSGCSTLDETRQIELQNEISVHGEIRRFRESTLDESGPVPVLSLGGNAYERGLAYGVLMFDQFRGYQGPIENYMKSRQQSMPFYKRIFSAPYIRYKIRNFLKNTPQIYIDELQGLADGLGGTLEQIALYTYFPYLNSGCTSIVSLPSNGNGIIHGRNWDFEPFLLGERPVLINYTAESGIKVWTVTSLGASLFHGCNDQGISLSMNTMDERKATTNGMAVIWRMRQILENASNMGQVDSIITAGENDNLHWLLTIASSRENTARVYNLTNEIQSYEELTNSKPLVVLNRPYFSDGSDNHLLKQNTDFFRMIAEHNVNRQKQADSFFEKQSVDTPQDMWNLLRNRDFTEPGLWLNRGSIANYSTMFSVVFDLSNNKFSFAVAPSWSSLRTVWEYNLSDGSFAQLLPEDPYCQTPEFLRNEAAFYHAEQALIDGTFSLADVDYHLGAYSIVRYSIRRFNPRKKDPQLQMLFEKAAETYPNVDLSYMGLGYYYRFIDPEKSIANFEKVLAFPDPSRDFSLSALQYIVDAYKELGDKDNAALKAAEWLEMFEILSEGHLVSNYHKKIARDMRKMAR